MDTNGNISV